MKNSQIDRVIKLVRRTGDKVVLMDNESDAVMMLMELGSYEKMLANSEGVEKLTEEELMEKINRDVAIWRASNDRERLETFDSILEKSPISRENSVVPPVTAPADRFAQEAPEPSFSTPKQPTNISREESASDIIAEEDEEKFYLEPVE
ncbi:MAG: hypothetical protein KBC69_03600 [Candidatus Magasanikbacteria bacterium]|nr:hypothetical protein [Candidatus Magasanikbacteria bacterium]